MSAQDRDAANDLNRGRAELRKQVANLHAAQDRSAVRPLEPGEYLRVTDPDMDAPDGSTLYDDERKQWLTRVGREWRIATQPEVDDARYQEWTE